MRQWSLGLLIGTAFFFLSGPLLAAPKVGIVLHVDGTVEPEMEICGQFTNGARVVLNSGASLTFNHFDRCEEITIHGSGELQVRTGSYSFTGGSPTVKQTACQKILHYVDPNLESAGISTRGLSVAVEITSWSRPLIVVLDHDPALNYVAEFKVEEPYVSVRIPLIGAKTAWPAASPSLTPGLVYNLTLVREEVRSEDVARIRVISKAEASLTERFILLDFKPVPPQ